MHDMKRDQTQIRALIGDGIGVYVVMRRFEGKRVRLLESFTERPEGAVITTGELSLLLEGARFTVHKRAGSIRRTGMSNFFDI
jgi:hypothetical protein